MWHDITKFGSIDLEIGASLTLELHSFPWQNSKCSKLLFLNSYTPCFLCSMYITHPLVHVIPFLSSNEYFNQRIFNFHSSKITLWHINWLQWNSFVWATKISIVIFLSHLIISTQLEELVTTRCYILAIYIHKSIASHIFPSKYFRLHKTKFKCNVFVQFFNLTYYKPSHQAYLRCRTHLCAKTIQKIHIALEKKT